MPALLLSAVCCLRREACVALAANLFLTIEFLRQQSKGWVVDTTSETQDQVERRLLLDIIIRKCTAILQLLSRKNQPLLIRWNAFLILDLCLNIVNCVTWLDIERYRPKNKLSVTHSRKERTRHFMWKTHLPVRVFTKIWIDKEHGGVSVMFEVTPSSVLCLAQTPSQRLSRFSSASKAHQTARPIKRDPAAVMYCHQR